MTLPRIDFPTYEVTVPSSKKKARISTMRVRDEKLLLMAKEGNSPSEIFVAIKNVVANCLVGGDLVDVDKLTLFDLEYLFLKIRSYSLGSTIKISYSDADDEKSYDFEINLDEVAVKFPGDIIPKIQVDEKTCLTMKYPLCSIYQSETFLKEDAKDTDLFDELVVNCLDKLFVGETVHDFKDDKPEEVRQFVDNLDVKTYGKVKDFIANLPTLYHEIKYTNSLGTEKTIKLSSLTDFFIF